MTSINLDNLSKDNRDRLQQRAATNGNSLESEMYLILTSVFKLKTAENSLKELLLAMPDVDEDDDFNRVRDNARAVSL
ncbi:MAG: DNA-binding protein [Cyanobacteria bacterium P01_F01_bin.143]